MCAPCSPVRERERKREREREREGGREREKEREKEKERGRESELHARSSRKCGHALNYGQTYAPMDKLSRSKMLLS